MICFLIGRVDSTGKETVAINVNNIGYTVYVSRPSFYQLNSEVKLFTYHVIRQDEQYLVGFPTITEKNLFLLLIKVQGIGAKTALAMLSAASPNQIISAINSEDIKFLKSLPLIGYKTARQIILDMKGCYSTSIEKNSDYDDVRTALISMGYKANIVDESLRAVYKEDLDKNELFKSAIKQIRENRR